MYKEIIVLSLAVALTALVTAGAIYFRCRRIRREKNRRIARVLHEQDLLARELEHVRIEKQAFERVLTTTLSAVAEKPAAEKPAAEMPGEQEADP